MRFKCLGRHDDQRGVLRRTFPVHLWQFVVAMLCVDVIVLAITGVSGVWEALAYLASAALVGYAAFHLCAALTGVRWRSHLIWVVAAGLLAVAVPKVWRQHHDSAAVARYYESQRRQVRAHCTRDRKAAAEAILKHWQARNASTWINCASSAPVGTYGNGHRFGEIHSTDICADVETTPFYDGGDGSRTLWFLSCRTRIDSVA